MADGHAVTDRQFELLLVRVVPHPLRDDFMTVGVVLVEPEGTFADVRVTRDWKRVGCFAPEIETEIFEMMEATVRERLKDVRQRGDLLGVLEERFGGLFDVGPSKALVAADPVAEMGTVTKIYLGPSVAVERTQRLGRAAIVGRMEQAFADAGLTGLLQRDINMQEFTGESDPFRVDFGFRVGTSLKMFQGLALNWSREPAVALAYRYARIRDGMKKRKEDARLTAIVSQEAMRLKEEAASGIALLRANDVAVRSVEEMPEIADKVRGELQA